MNFPFKFRYVSRRGGELALLFYTLESIERFGAPWTSDGLNESPVVRELFTGRLDKNGKEIYEGDIVVAWNDYGPGGEGKNTYSVTLGLHGSNLEDWTFVEDGFLPEVIGNIHQNPELLEKKDERK